MAAAFGQGAACDGEFGPVDLLTTKQVGDRFDGGLLILEVWLEM